MKLQTESGKHAKWYSHLKSPCVFGQRCLGTRLVQLKGKNPAVEEFYLIEIINGTLI